MGWQFDSATGHKINIKSANSDNAGNLIGISIVKVAAVSVWLFVNLYFLKNKIIRKYSFFNFLSSHTKKL